MADIQLIRGSNGNGPAVRPVVTAARSSGSLTLKVNSTTNLPSRFIGTWGKLNQDTGKLISSSIRDFYGEINGADIDLVRMADGFTDDGNEVGDVIVIKPNTDWTHNLADVLQNMSIPTGVRQEYFGTKDTFEGSPYRHGWLFMEKNTAYEKSMYQELYNHLKAVDSASVKTDSGATFMFADKWFGRTGVSLDASQTEFNTLGKAYGHKGMQKHTHQGVYSNTFLQWRGGGAGNISSAGTASLNIQGGSLNEEGTGDSGNIQPSLTLNYIIKT